MFTKILMAAFMLSMLSVQARPGDLSIGINPGTLEVSQIDGKKPAERLEMPLKHTDVKIEVSGFVASAVVTQQYQNPFEQPIEAVYTFPLPNDAAVDDMQMTIGKRVIKGLIKRKQEARKIYEQASEQGQRASLLEQERPNIFTQSVANIMPGDNIVITIRYVNILEYSEGNYELVFPMVVGPRYIPGNIATGHSGTGWSPDTDKVPDASKITPPVLKPGERTGHDISLAVKLNAGVSIKKVHSTSHVIDIKNVNLHESIINIHPADTLPNKDFILRYQVAGKAPELATIAHHDERGGFFTLMIQPQQTVTEEQVFPRELIFIVDTSGSMSGFPIEKSKQAMRKLIKGMRSLDMFNVVRFAGDTGTLWKQSRPYNQTNADEALRYVDSFRGMGGTEMRTGIVEALGQPAAEGYLRIAFLMTDGYVGNEFGIFQAIEKERRGARIFSLGVGSSVNRYLLDRAAEVGRGEAFYVRQDENSDKVINKFFKRVDKPALAHIEIDWGSLDVNTIYPAKVPDLWAGQPILLHGRYNQGGKSTVTVRGELAGHRYVQELSVNLPQNQPNNESMATVWARQKVHQLMNKMVRAGQTQDLIEQVTTVGLDFKLMTQWTSFVAVEERIVNVEGKPQTVVQPVELPEGVAYEGIFGEQAAEQDTFRTRSMPAKQSSSVKYKKFDKNIMSSAPMLMKPMAPPPLSEVEEEASEAPVKENSEALESKVETADAPESSQLPEDIGNTLILSDDEDDEKLDTGITFAAGKTELSARVKNILNAIAKQVCQDMINIKSIVVTGHTDNSSADDFKQKLSLERAIVVVDYLVSKCPAITKDKLVITGQADSQPIADNNTEVGRAKNRRVMIEIKK
ncbi:VIT domain-containing protein [Candidatus Halobeggiatoa sp. HSG11]|nr:VIT domain-containing protein [Candidatus Halobeggiatoa sp. HSG11]